MTCDDIKILLSELVDGEISAADRAKVEEHLATCADCRAELDALQRLTGIMHELPKEVPPRDISAEVVAHIKRSQLKAVQSHAKAPISRWLRVGGLVAAAAAVVLVVNVAIKNDTPEPFEQAARPAVPATDKKVEVAKGDLKEAEYGYQEKLKESNKLAKEMAAPEERAKDADMVARVESKKEVADSAGAPALAPSPATAPAAPADVVERDAAEPPVDMTMEVACNDIKEGTAQVREIARQMQGRIIEAENGQLVVEVPEEQMAKFGELLVNARNVAVQNVFSNNYGGFKEQQAIEVQRQVQNAQSAMQEQMAKQAPAQQAEQQATKRDGVEMNRELAKGGAQQDKANAGEQSKKLAETVIQRGQAFRNRQQMNQMVARTAPNEGAQAVGRAKGMAAAPQAPGAPQEALKSVELKAEKAPQNGREQRANKLDLLTPEQKKFIKEKLPKFDVNAEVQTDELVKELGSIIDNYIKAEAQLEIAKTKLEEAKKTYEEGNQNIKQAEKEYKLAFENDCHSKQDMQQYLQKLQQSTTFQPMCQQDGNLPRAYIYIELNVQKQK